MARCWQMVGRIQVVTGQWFASDLLMVGHGSGWLGDGCWPVVGSIHNYGQWLAIWLAKLMIG